MIKNVIFDIGGVICDDGYKNLAKVLNVKDEEGEAIGRIAFGGDFRKCLLGKLDIDTHIKILKEKHSELAEKIEYVLSPWNYKKTFPTMNDTLNLILELKKQGYKIYLLSNITKESFEYLNNTVDFEKYFDGGLYSYQEGTKKPDNVFYESLIKKYRLAKDECIFFDDKDRNVEVGNSLGIKSIKFKSIDDIKNNLF